MANGTQTVRVRKNVRMLGGSQDDLFWYAKAVANLKLRSVADPTSWQYQAAVHGYLATNPNRSTGGSLPSSADQTRFWNQCQHATWYFLPWHRGYVAYFEQIVAAAVVREGGPPDWALPYWNYSAPDPKSRLMPDAFVSPTLSDGSQNPLYVQDRDSTTNDFGFGDDTVSLKCLTFSPFEGVATGGDPGFGGPRTKFNHLGGAYPFGHLEAGPHNYIHDEIGGLMGDPRTAALDPIFWLHHSNIDRLWEVWTNRNPQFVNPSVPAWLTGCSFELHDESGATQSFSPSQMLDTKAVLHGYKYDDISDPVPGSPSLFVDGLRVKRMSGIARPPQLVGASKVSIPLVGPITTAEIVFYRPTVKFWQRLLALVTPEPSHVYLNLENVTGTGRPGTYKVYIDAPPPGPETSLERALFVGLMSTFGVEAASSPDGPHAGSGITTVLEITDQVESLRSQQRWDESRLRVLLVKERRPGMERAMARAAEAKLQIGRISVYYH